MITLIRIAFAAAAMFIAQVSAQNFPDVQISLSGPVVANTPFSIIASAPNICVRPYPESEQPPDFVLRGNELEMTIYLRIFNQNTTPIPPCPNRIQIYTAPALPVGTYKIALRARFYRDIGAGSFTSPFTQGDFVFEVGGALGVTQVPASSGWSLVLLFLGMLGAVRWVSGHSGR